MSGVHVRKKRRTRSGLNMDFNASDRATRRVIAPYLNIVRRGARAGVKREKDNKYFTFYLQQKPTLLKKNFTEFLNDNVELPMLLHETGDALKDVTNAAGVRLYLVDQSAGDIYISSENREYDRHKIRWKIQQGASIAAHVACTKAYVMVDDIIADPRFPDGIPYTSPMIKSVICVPILTPEDECYAVLELYKDIYQAPFQPIDMRISLALSGWMGVCIYMNEQIVSQHCQQRLNHCLIELTKCYFSDTVILEKMISEIVSFAKQTVNAEKTTFFVIDPDSEDIAADVYDGDPTSNLLKANLKVRFGKDRGVAGLVARTGVPVNIKDAYNDPKFNMEVDPLTGAITRSVLCMPVIGLEGVLGVVQATNKVDGPVFTAADEKMFKSFAFYCALALQYAQMYRRSKKSEAKGIVTTGILKRHGILPCSHDLQCALENSSFYENPEAIKEFSWYISLYYTDNMPQIVMHMIVDLVGVEAMNMFELTKFALSVRNFYRKVGYHNWEHAFNVCHCMYNILLRNKDVFTATEMKALMVATICHDVDHGGVTPNFLMVTSDVMAELYETSPWENHHYTVTMIILSEINIFNDMSADEYNSVSELIKHAILSTDLLHYFKIRAKFMRVLIDETFDYNIKQHRDWMISIMMNVCDLSGQCKPFDITKRITDNLLEEFYAEGDIEKALGNQPLSLMDRDRPDCVATDQIKFLNVLVLPCCDMLRKCLANTGELYNNAMKVMECWVESQSLQAEKCWRQDQSVVREKIKKN